MAVSESASERMKQSGTAEGYNAFRLLANTLAERRKAFSFLSLSIKGGNHYGQYFID